MVKPACFVHIPSLPETIAMPGGYGMIAELAYEPTNTNYVGGTSCALVSYVTPTPWAPPTATAKCTLPASVSGKPYSVTPVIYVPRTVSSRDQDVPYTCDPIPVASINKGNFQFACKSLRGKDVGDGSHTISWKLPTAAAAAASVTLRNHTFIAGPPISTTTYVVNTARASTTLIPSTTVRVAASTSTTVTNMAISTISVPTGTSTCYYTVTVTPRASRRRLRRADSQRPDSESLVVPDSGVVDDDAADAADALADDNSSSNGKRTDAAAVVKLEERAATPTIGKPDHTYPPYGVSTVYVKSISTRTWTDWDVETYYTFLRSTTTTVTVSYMSFTGSTVTVTATPGSR